MRLISYETRCYNIEANRTLLTGLQLAAVKQARTSKKNFIFKLIIFEICEKNVVNFKMPSVARLINY